MIANFFKNNINNLFLRESGSGLIQGHQILSLKLIVLYSKGCGNQKNGKSFPYTRGRECYRKAGLFYSSDLQRTDFRDYIKSEFYQNDEMFINVVFLSARIKEELFLDDKKFTNKGPVSNVASGCGGTLAIFLALNLLLPNIFSDYLVLLGRKGRD